MRERGQQRGHPHHRQPVWPDRDSRYAYTSQAPATTVTPAGTLYFQPSGRITSDGAGSNALNASIAIAGEVAITTVGETGALQ